MTPADPGIYFVAFAVALTLSLFLTPLVRLAALRLGVVDTPSSAVKTHTEPTPVFGGVAIFAAFALTMLALRFTTSFPSGTLYSLRGLLLGGTLVFLLGLVDDLLRPNGVDYKPKFLVQFLAVALLVLYGMRVRFIHPSWVAAAFTMVWAVGVTNAFNIIDVMDGLSASQAAIAALGFLLINFPSEEIYVNFASAAVAGAALGFLPWNFSKRRKIFMGDSGSLTLGFLLAGISLGTRYSEYNDAGLLAPVLILFVPVFDTVFVSLLRLNKGQSPFLGSKDHFALRLERLGLNRHQVVLVAALAGVILSFAAFLAVSYDLKRAIAVYMLVAAVVLWLGRRMSLVEMR